ncbi:MAG: HAD hydrolase-like protein [Patescibacteria group bacterium]
MKMLLFDANNTLLNDFFLWKESIDTVFRHFGKIPLPVNEYVRALVTGDYVSLYHSYGINANKKELNRIFIPTYRKKIDQIGLAPGVEEILEWLSQKGIILGIITGSLANLVNPILKKHDVIRFLTHKEFDIFDKEASIIELAKTSSINIAECGYLGDLPLDINAANAVGAVSIAYLNGNIDEKIVLRAEPKHSIRHMSELRSLF